MTTMIGTSTPVSRMNAAADDRFDIVVIGAGPGGYVAAIRAAQHGLHAAVVERGALGGACTNRGCIPTKAMLHGADVAHAIATADALGFAVERRGFALETLVGYADGVVARLRGGIEGLLRGNGVTLIRGSATLPAKGVVEVDETWTEDAPGTSARRILSADDIIIATGASPRAAPFAAPDGERIWTSTDALRAQRLPASLTVIGSGAIGAEFASLYRDLGTEVTLLEAASAVMPAEDAEVSALVEQVFRSRGMHVFTGISIASVDPVGTSGDAAQGVRTRFADRDGGEHETVTDHVLVAVGVAPNSAGLGLEALGVRLERGFVVTDGLGFTGVAGIHAIGDVAGAPCLAHKASHDALVVVDHLVGERGGAHPVAPAFVPRGVYSRPQVASLGLTEVQARERGIDVEVGRFDLAGNGKAIAVGEAHGFAKVLFDRGSGELVGAHLVGPDATELIPALSVAHALEATDAALAEAIIPHPTVSEAAHEAVLDALGRVIHWPPRGGTRAATTAAARR